VESGTEILYFTEEVDEFCAQILHTFQDKEFRSVLDQEIEEGAEKKAEEAADAHKAVFDFVKETLGDQVKEVKASARLKSHPVCLTAGEGLSFEMEKYFQAVQPDSAIRAERILELNVEHPAFQALEAAVTADPEKAKKYATLLYDQALLIAGLVPKFSALLTTIPQCVLGGATISVFASIAMTGIKLITTQEMNFRNTSVVGLAVALGVGVTQASASLAMFPAWVTTVFGKTPVVIATVAAVFLNLVLPKEKPEVKKETEEK